MGNEDVLIPVHGVCNAMPITSRLLHKDTVEEIVLFISFVDETLRGSQSDMLFKVELATGGPALVYVLAEHKSCADPGTPLQLAAYMVSYQNILIAHLIGMFFLSEPISDISRLFNRLPRRNSDNVSPRIWPMT